MTRHRPPSRTPKPRPIRVGGGWCAGVALIGLCLLATGCKDEKPDQVETKERAADTALRYVGNHQENDEGGVKRSTYGPAKVAEITPAIEPAPKPTEPVPPDANCMTPECHVTYLTASHLHGPLVTEECAECHNQDTGEHVYPLRAEGNDLCVRCHSIGNTRTYQHEPVLDPGCLECHSPHASDTDFLLTEVDSETLCVKCHPGVEGLYDHEPYAEGGCTTCHEPHEANHSTLLRGGSGPKHCYLCHEETQYAIANAPYRHEAIEKEGCTVCHSAHTSDYDLHLKNPTEQLCFGCHEELEKTMAGATAPHAAVFTADKCVNCHDPHATGRPKLLKDRQTTLCLQCHNKAIITQTGRTIPDMTASVTNRIFFHGPVETGECSACHSVHGASHASLLRDSAPDSFYAAFDLTRYTLCLNCHEPDRILVERTTTLTGFRDGDLNLHYLHVHRDEKGRTCSACHAIHGSDQPKHIANFVMFDDSTWPMPINFKISETGGTCAPGCHERMTYDREEAVNIFAPPSPGGAP